MDNAFARRGALALWDIGSWALATAVVVGVRLDFTLNEVQWDSVLVFWLMASALLVVIGYATKFYRGRFLVGSFDEALGLALHSSGVVAAITLSSPLPCSTRRCPAACPSWSRRWRSRGCSGRALVLPRAARPAGRRSRPVRTPVLIYGAGDAGRQVLRLLRSDRNAGYERRRLPRRQPRQATPPHPAACRSLGAGHSSLRRPSRDVAAVVLAVPGAAGGSWSTACRKAARPPGLDFLVLPQLREMIGGQRRARPTSARSRSATSSAATRSTTERRRHRRLPHRQARAHHRRRRLDRLRARAPGPPLRPAPAGAARPRRVRAARRPALDLRARPARRAETRCSPTSATSDALRARSSRSTEPEIVFHAAALKHLPMLERFPDEGWKTNVVGTLNVLERRRADGVAHFVNISTDKAADATSVLGSTKRLAEQLTAWQAERRAAAYISVRFGNVLGSRGSMLHTFNAQIASGGPVTVTHPDVTRYFMTIPEACELVVQAGAIGRAGEVHGARDGRAGADPRRRQADDRALRGDRVDIVFTGLRPGEKLHEVLFSDDEDVTRSDGAPDDPLASSVPRRRPRRAQRPRDPRRVTSDRPHLHVLTRRRHRPRRTRWSAPCARAGSRRSAPRSTPSRPNWLPSPVAAYAVALSSGTAALHLGTAAAGRRPGHRRDDLVDDVRRDGQRDHLHRRHARLRRLRRDRQPRPRAG